MLKCYIFFSCFSVNKLFKLEFVFQFIREYTGKVDELIKDKIEAAIDAKAKESEEKDVIKQQVYISLSSSPMQ